jgi:hypothetical protein
MSRLRLAPMLALVVLLCVVTTALAFRVAPAPAPVPPAVDTAPRESTRPAPLPPITPFVGPAAREAVPTRSAAQRRATRLRRLEAGIRWRRSTSVGTTGAGGLLDGVRLPAQGRHFFTLDPVLWTLPNRPDRRWGSSRLLRTILRVARAYATAHPDAPRVAIGDLSREGGGSFDARYGIVGEFGPGRGTLGHVSHQNGLDVDIYYPRNDGKERGPRSLGQIDRRLSQDLVDRFVRAGAQCVFVGPRMGLTGPPGVVQSAARHDDHLHVRLPPARVRTPARAVGGRSETPTW